MPSSVSVGRRGIRTTPHLPEFQDYDQCLPVSGIPCYIPAVSVGMMKFFQALHADLKNI